MIEASALTAEHFKPIEGDSVTISADGAELQATLVEIKTLGAGVREGGAFSLLFQGPGAPGLSQATYRLTHSAIGTQDMFLVPVARTEAGYQYEAVFT